MRRNLIRCSKSAGLTRITTKTYSRRIPFRNYVCTSTIAHGEHSKAPEIKIPINNQGNGKGSKNSYGKLWTYGAFASIVAGGVWYHVDCEEKHIIDKLEIQYNYGAICRKNDQYRKIIRERETKNAYLGAKCKHYIELKNRIRDLKKNVRECLKECLPDLMDNYSNLTGDEIQKIVKNANLSKVVSAVSDRGDKLMMKPDGAYTLDDLNRIAKVLDYYLALENMQRKYAGKSLLPVKLKYLDIGSEPSNFRPLFNEETNILSEDFVVLMSYGVGEEGKNKLLGLFTDFYHTNGLKRIAKICDIDYDQLDEIFEKLPKECYIIMYKLLLNSVHHPEENYGWIIRHLTKEGKLDFEKMTYYQMVFAINLFIIEMNKSDNDMMKLVDDIANSNPDMKEHDPLVDMIMDVIHK